MHRLVALIIALALPAPAWAQQPVRADSTARDTTRVTQLPEVKVTVTRTTEPLTRAPFATGVLDRDAIQRGQQTVGIDEALNNIPGVVVSNRYNFSLDQRISIRGRRDRVRDRARRARAVRAARAGAGRQRAARRRRVLQVAELDVGPVRQRERHAVGVPVQGRRFPSAQCGRVPPA